MSCQLKTLSMYASVSKFLSVDDAFSLLILTNLMHFSILQHPLNKIDLIFMLGSCKATVHHILKQVFIDTMIERLEQLVSKNVS